LTRTNLQAESQPMPTTGKKNQKGQPEKYGEMKKRVNFTLTPTGIAQLEGLAVQRQLSKSEFIEQVARGEISTQTQPDALTSVDKEVIKKCFSRPFLMLKMN